MLLIINVTFITIRVWFNASKPLYSCNFSLKFLRSVSTYLKTSRSHFFFNMFHHIRHYFMDFFYLTACTSSNMDIYKFTGRMISLAIIHRIPIWYLPWPSGLCNTSWKSSLGMIFFIKSQKYIKTSGLFYKWTRGN